MKTFELRPLDTLFFRDGRPFNSGEMGQIEAEGAFPPQPSTVVGCLRAALAMQQGWNGGPWDETLKATLGDGEELGQLSFQGPILRLGKKLLFATPLHLLGRLSETNPFSWTAFSRLVPGDSMNTDCGKIRLPSITEPQEGMRTISKTFITTEGMEKFLGGGSPTSEQIMHQDRLWRSEPRVGIHRNPITKVTEDNALYQSSHTRPVGNVSLYQRIRGLPEGWIPNSPTPLGGEGRLTWIKEVMPTLLPKCPPLSAVNSKILYTVTLITPADIRNGSWKQMGRQFESLPGKLVSACVGQPLRFGGWEGHDPKASKPLPLRSLLPPGSTWFLTAEPHEADNISSWHGKHIGSRAKWGYGQIVIGLWKEIE